MNKQNSVIDFLKKKISYHKRRYRSKPRRLKIDIDQYTRLIEEIKEATGSEVHGIEEFDGIEIEVSLPKERP